MSLGAASEAMRSLRDLGDVAEEMDEERRHQLDCYRAFASGYSAGQVDGLREGLLLGRTRP